MSASGLCVYISLFPRDSEQLTTGPWSHYSYISSIFSISRDQFKFTFYQNIFTLTRFVPAAHTITTSLLAAASIINQLWQERERGGRSQMLRGPQQWSSAHWYVTCGQSLHSTHPGGTPPHLDLSSNISNLLRVFLFVFRKLDRTIWKNLHLQCVLESNNHGVSQELFSTDLQHQQMSGVSGWVTRTNTKKNNLHSVHDVRCEVSLCLSSNVALPCNSQSNVSIKPS